MSDAVRFPSASELRSVPLFAHLGSNDRLFLERVFGTPPARYLERLRDVGMCRGGRVLDLGCGFGQWSLCLAATNAEVEAVDPQPVRLAVLEALAECLGVRNLRVRRGTGEAVPLDDASVDGVFCFGVLQYTDPVRLFSECARLLRPGGLAYVLGKDLGGYLFDWCEGRNATDDFDPRECAADAFANSLSLERHGVAQRGTRWGDRIIALEKAVEVARAVGLEVVESGAEGTTRADRSAGHDGDGPRATFFRTEYRGFRSSYEVLVRKPAGARA